MELICFREILFAPMSAKRQVIVISINPLPRDPDPVFLLCIMFTFRECFCVSHARCYFFRSVQMLLPHGGQIPKDEEAADVVKRAQFNA